MQDRIDIHRLANLVKLNISQEEQEPMLAKINDVLKMIQQVCDQDVAGIAPLAHPIDTRQHLRGSDAQPLTQDERQRLLELGADEREGFFVVPRVVE